MERERENEREREREKGEGRERERERESRQQKCRPGWVAAWVGQEEQQSSQRFIAMIQFGSGFVNADTFWD
jgi:hypothetical protein